nr:tRNA lysidine(34) synthetase TilS [Deltaproteobacteria bacterium]
RRCGHAWRGRAHEDDQIPVDFDLDRLPGPAAAADGSLAAVQKRARTLPLRVLEVVRRHRLWSPGDRVCVAVSGGLDSTVLLELLAELAHGHGAQLEVASVNHGLRPESAAEVARVGRRARTLGLPFHAIDLQLETGPNLAARARDARWLQLEALGCARIATAHHRDDQAETVLQHLLRGSGARGLRGMTVHDRARVRPLLFEPRVVLRRWAEDRGLSWDEDPSNPASERGRIRAVMPALDELRAGAARGLARSARLLAREDAFLEAHVLSIWKESAVDGRFPVRVWLEHHPAVQLRLLMQLLEPLPHGVAVRADQLERLLAHPLPSGAVFGLPHGWSIEVHEGWLVLGSTSGASRSR